MSSHNIEDAGIIASKVTAYGGAAGTVFFGLTLNELGVVIGSVVAILGLALGQYWSWRRDRRERIEMEHRMRYNHGTDWDQA